MKAIQYASYGNSAVLQLNQVAMPVCKENEVLIRVKATTVNPFDIKVRSGIMQQRLPIQFPYTPGSDASGIVETVGSGVSRLKSGDHVFATCFGGSYAEYVVIDEARVTLMPEQTTFNEAAALAVPLCTAYAVLVEHGNVTAGQRILIQGAAGAVGLAMVQMARTLGAYITGTASGKGLDLLRALGADEVIDYKSQDLTKLLSDIDLVADLAGGPAQARLFEVIRKGGKLLSIVIPPSPQLAEKFQVGAKFVESNANAVKLDYGKRLVEQGKIRSHIAATMKLDQAAAAQDVVSAGGVNGKVVLEVA